MRAGMPECLLFHHISDAEVSAGLAKADSPGIIQVYIAENIRKGRKASLTGEQKMPGGKCDEE